MECSYSGIMSNEISDFKHERNSEIPKIAGLPPLVANINPAL